MDIVGSEIGQKMRSAIKAKLTELGCYVDDELPDYVMVMVANKRTRSQMEDDLQLFLGDNTQLFVNWLHQVLKKLQEVTVAVPLKIAEAEIEKKDAPAAKEKKSKVKKDKTKKKSESTKKSKKKDKEKAKKLEKKLHKSKKKSKEHESIRPNIPPLLMNIEKNSEPSITDVFAGQILKNHGIILETPEADTQPDVKPTPEEINAVVPIIEPWIAPREEQIKEITEIEAKIQGLKQKLAEQLDSMSEDEDFLNIRTEAEELMNDFADDVLQEISQPPPTSVTAPPKSPPIVVDPETIEIKETPTDPVETLPQIELKLPKRPVRERLGAREETKETKTDSKEMKSEPKEKKSNSKEKKSVLNEKEKSKERERRHESPERFTPEREPDFWPKTRSAKSRLGEVIDSKRKSSLSDNSEQSEPVHKRITSKVSVLESRSQRVSCASVVRVRPRPRVSAPAGSLLMRAVADAHKSLCNAPPKQEPEPSKIKRALVLPMRRCADAQHIVIQVPAGDDDAQADAISLDMDSDIDKSPKNQMEEKVQYKRSPIIKKFTNTEYVPSLSRDRLASRMDDKLIVETINIHNPTVDKDKSTQFIVTMDGFNPNAFLAKKLMTEGLLNDDEVIESKPKQTNESQEKTKMDAKENMQDSNKTTTEETNNSQVDKEVEPQEKPKDDDEDIEVLKKKAVEKKRLSNTSDESDTQVIINKEKSRRNAIFEEESPPAKKKRASPIVFDVTKKEENIIEKEKVRERTNSVSSDNHVTVTTNTSSHKYDSVPSLSTTERKPVWCRAFPSCRFGGACAFQHPRCRFLASCTRRGCVYDHQPESQPALASHVVPVANYKSISTAPLPAICKFYPGCVNPACHFYHPKPCRYGNACANKIECNFYHSDVQKYKYPA